ncbi:Asp-tRNA(Asn)/Glu-tRNA(Gln) amidotransferase subunit GatB [Geoalkalibacter halelectricus]|uniref:Aspartyl/glutamyl-tRNA(Asn/Gln) amidotransferase subunit B n=2 Tax=Geoalkalibacter halelectricus TaxID=2847045 RepID=A0ABY5ZLQ9_9BACT|nr:Asp-tRNA(Asn)/Glu-tRNA(Gln) amidotransferase subunit GatB [Geoalkalibacter halelectricus]MDO3378618.1 Asp-tRNA(Asn)/Glu-tRNA(Gln) amidotransferase subunit GatB [Geoalkalibacter halelectricus]UWZ80070.1 Asp-tRNA(Asn)/Glu-tRNA(Gln) amidotransferase subunit GatB [Geoalkalibacter halelectricus]
MSSKYETVIGLEVHVQLTTDTKIFCGCSTRFGEAPNSQTCPVCLGLPGALPVLNGKAVDFAILAGLATNCRIAPRSIFARKNYFYPDLPKGYQISQFELPICEHGRLDIETAEGGPKTIGITRIHMEEDAGKSMHGDTPETSGSSLVDLNRACTPLLEIVSEPDMRSPEEAIAYLKKLHQIVVYLGVCDGSMEQGSFRCDANVSVRPYGQEKFGTRAEIKNINSFRFIKQAIEYEVERQIELIEDGGQVVQETRLFDPDTGVTRSMRGKEEAHDYRYFPDPDLVPLAVDEDWIARMRDQMPELPEARRARFVTEYGIPEYDAEVLTAERALADYYDACVKEHGGGKVCANWVMGEVIRGLNEQGISISECPVTPAMLAGMLKRIDDNTISGKIAKTVFEQMWQTGQDADTIIAEKGLKQVTDTGAIEAVIDEILAANPAQVEEYRGGKEKVFGFFVGQVMKASKGKANPAAVNDLLKKKLAGG